MHRPANPTHLARTTPADTAPARARHVGTLRRGRRAILAGTLALVALAAPVADPQGIPTMNQPGRPAPPPSRAAADDPTWIALRRPVLGLTLERRADGALHRVTTDDDPPAVLAEGDLTRCQRALADELLARHGSGQPNVPLPTLGGAQLWADVCWCAGWRIQRHALDGHHRLLDPQDVRRAWGEAAACRAVLESRRADGAVDASPEQLVVLLHGLGRTRHSLDALAESLTNQGFACVALSYPSTRATLDEHVAALDGLLDQLDDVRAVSFVTHSLGGIVVRALLARPSPWRERMTLGRVVMLAPPNQGSALARALDGALFGAALGPSAQALATRAIAALPPPPCAFGIVAAGRGDDGGLNPWIDGDDDGVVAVEETRLPGAADQLVVRGLHTFLMDDPAVQAATANFLRTGRFAAPEPVEPPRR